MTCNPPSPPPPTHDPRLCISRRVATLRIHAADARRDLLARVDPPAVVAARIVNQASADVLQANWLEYELDTWTEGAACPLAGRPGACAGCRA